MLDDINATDSPADFEQALRLLRSSIEEEPGAAPKIYVLSEFRRGAFTLSDTPSVVFNDTPIESVLVGHTGTPADNTQIIEIEPQRSLFLGDSARTSVRVSLKRFGAQIDAPGSSVIRVSTVFTDEQSGPVEGGRASVKWAAGQTQQDVFVSVQTPSTGGSIGAMVASIDRDRLPGDDTRSAPLSVSDFVQVGVIDRIEHGSARTDPVSPSRWIELALQPDRSSRLQSSLIDPADINRATLAELSSVFLLRPDLVSAESWDVLHEFVARGRGLVIFPPASLDAHAWVETALTKLGVDLEVGAEKNEYESAQTLTSRAEHASEYLRMLRTELEELLRPVRVFASLSIVPLAGNGEVLFTLASGDPWVVRVRPDEADSGAGEVVFFSSALSLEWSTLAATPLMVPVIQEIVRENAGSTVRRRVTEAGSLPALPPQIASLTSLRSGETLHPSENAAWPAIYNMGTYSAAGERGEALGPLCVNPAVTSGNTGTISIEESTAWFGRARPRCDVYEP